MASYFEFDDGSSKFRRNRRKNKKSNPYHTPTSTGAGTGTAYQFSSTISVDDTEDGNGSLTYSASSSQAGESTDSSIIDTNGIFLTLESEQKYHLMQQQKAQRLRHGNGGSSRSLRKENSAIDSLGYSDDDLDCDESINFSSWNTISGSGQQSDSHAHDGGGFNKCGNTPKSIANKQNDASPTSVAADINSCCAGSNGTPNSPPPRHDSRKKMSHHDEVWYQKWWMCGFTDALNLNP